MSQGSVSDSIAQVFCSYAHKDLQYARDLHEQLAALRRSGCIQTWSDQEIRPGDQWAQAISDKLEAADVVLMLISSSFIQSDYCYNIEMTRALELADAGQTIALPILVRDCDWESMPFAKLQMMPNDSHPIRSIASRSDHERDEAWRHITRTIRGLLARHRPPPAVEKPSLRVSDDSVDSDVVLSFLRAWPHWGFNIARLRKWGGRQPGFEQLSQMSSTDLTNHLQRLLESGLARTFQSKSGGRLYKAA